METSLYDDPEIKKQLEALAKLKPVSSGLSATTKNAFEDSQVRADLQGLAQISQQQIEGSQSVNTSSVHQDSAVQADLQGLMQLSQNAQPTSIHLAKNALNGGLISLGMAARFDQPRFQNGCFKLQNMVAMPCGGITKRPGMKFLGLSASANVRLIPFIFSANESRILEIGIYDALSSKYGQCYMNVWDTSGLLHESDIELPFTESNFQDINFCQSADVLFYAHPSLPPGKIMRYADNDWRHEVIKWEPDIEPPELTWCGGQGPEPSNESRRVNYYYVATSIDADTGEESDPSEPIEALNQYPVTDSRYIGIDFTPVANAAEYRFYRKEAGVYGFVGLVSGDTTVYKFEDHNYTPDTEDTPPNHKNPFDGANNYPSVVFLHQQRLGYAASNSKPLTIWMSQSGSFESMASSVPPDDDDAIELTMAANQANKIIWCLSDRSGLAIGTEGGEWLLNASEGSAITPSDMALQPQTNYGSSAKVDPIKANANIIFLQRGSRVVREFGYSFTEDRYNASDLTLLCRDLFSSHYICSWCWQPEPYGILWCVLSGGGGLAALTYLREHEVCAWHRHTTDGWVNSVCSIPDDDGEWRVFLHTARQGNFSYIEILDKFNGSHSDHFSGDMVCRCIPCFADSSETFTQIKKINAVKIRVTHSYPFQIVATGGNKFNQQIGPVMNVPTNKDPGLTELADWCCPISAGFLDNPGVELIMDGSDPVTILGIEASVELATNLGNQGG